MNNYPFIKMQTQGNDYIFFDFTEGKIPDLDFSQITPRLSNRHFGIGADGVVLILTDTEADVQMRIFNRDGSEAETCGSALRSIAWHQFLKLNQKKIRIKTLADINQTEIIKEAEENLVQVNMGKPELEDKIPLEVKGFKGYRVKLYNPHFVIPHEDIESLNLFSIGPIIQTSNSFPNGINLDLIQVIDRGRIKLKFWERGSGATMSCGSGACAATYWGIARGLLEKEVKAIVPGGELTINFRDSEIFLKGSVKVVFQGEIQL